MNANDHMEKTGILVAAHYECVMPDDPLYIPVLAGSALRDHMPEGYTRDDTGDNISDRNASFCELTALYWGWKNLDLDIIGLCHYRRFFASPCDIRKLLNKDETVHLLKLYDAILPKARNYRIETNYTQYAHSHNGKDLEVIRDIIAERHPAYIEAFDRRMSMTCGHRFNMFVMKKNMADMYCSWLFDILAELEKRLDISSYDENERRVFGFVAERLLDVWTDANGLRTTDLEYIFTVRENLLKKAAAMCARKLKADIKSMTERLAGRSL